MKQLVAMKTLSDRRVLRALAVVCALFSLAKAGPAKAGRYVPQAESSLSPGTRVLLDAHNAYPDGDRFTDRLDRALWTGVPVAIEQDLVWYRDPRTGISRSIVSHGPPFTGQEPTLDEHFFQRIRPIIDDALRENRRETWPVITLNLDFKTNEPEHHAAVLNLLGRYESWLTTARRTASERVIAELEPGPLLVLTGEADEQKASFHDRVPLGDKLLLFGAVHTRVAETAAEARVRPVETLPDASPEPLTNYRRWWNNPWNVVELGGQARAGEWTSDDEKRLQRIVEMAHRAGLWIRFYTLNGHDPLDTSGGWTAGYNFGSKRAAIERWQAVVRNGVDFVAVDQYEEFSELLSDRKQTAAPEHAAPSSRVQLTGTLTRNDYERLFERSFDVPAGIERIDVELGYDAANRTVIDLGLRGPAGFRGWSGGGQQRIFVSSHSASYGYTPGSIEPGRWAVVLGVPNIREGTVAGYTLTVRTSKSSGDWPTLRRGPGWYVGDLHAHSGHSDGRTTASKGGRVPVPPEHVFQAAKAAGLDFVALTDHNTASHWADADRLQSLYPDLLLLHAREVTTYRGHLNAFGEKHFVDFRLTDRRPMRTLIADLAAAGALVSINHPERPDDETCMGCGWNDRDDATLRSVHAVEVVNGDVIEGRTAGWAFWAALLNGGHRLAAIGGSDEHSPDEISEQQIGHPTTVIGARELSESALLDGLRAGRVYVRTRNPDGPNLELWAQAGERRFELGDEVPPGYVTLNAIVGSGQGQAVMWVRNGEVIATATVPADGRIRQEVAARSGDWFSLVLRDGGGPTLFSGALYTRP